MTKFTDANGRVWTIHLTIDAIDAINAVINRDLEPGKKPFDLLNITDNAEGGLDPVLFRVLFTSPRRTAEILSHAVAWEKGDVDEGQALANGLRGDALSMAFTAFFEELSCFFSEGLRPVVRQLMPSCQALMARKGIMAAEILRDIVAAAVQSEESPATASPGPAGN